MKKYLAVLSLILICTSTCYAWWNSSRGAGHTAGGATCDSAGDSITGSSVATESVGAYSNRQGLVTQFTAGSSYTVCAVEFYLTKSGENGTTVNLTACIYENNAGLPGSVVDCSAAVEQESFSTTAGFQGKLLFTGLSVALTNSSVYHVGLIADDLDSTDHLLWHKSAYSGGNTSQFNGSTWSNHSDDPFMFKLYKE